MLKLVALGLVLCASQASAQFLVTGPSIPAGTASSLSSSYQGVTPVGAAGGSGDNDITPTMQRQRAATALQVHQAFPDLQASMARTTPQRARYIYARAEKKVMRSVRIANAQTK